MRDKCERCVNAPTRPPRGRLTRRPPGSWGRVSARPGLGPEVQSLYRQRLSLLRPPSTRPCGGSTANEFSWKFDLSLELLRFSSFWGLIGVFTHERSSQCVRARARVGESARDLLASQDKKFWENSVSGSL